MARSGVSQKQLGKIGAVVGVEGIEKIQANIAENLNRMTGQRAKRVWMHAALLCVAEIKSLVPVKTGKLKEAIGAGYGKPEKPNVIVGVNWKKAPHAYLVEYGHGRVGSGGAHAHPYFRPGVNASRGIMAAVIAKGMREIASGIK